MSIASTSPTGSEGTSVELYITGASVDAARELRAELNREFISSAAPDRAEFLEPLQPIGTLVVLGPPRLPEGSRSPTIELPAEGLPTTDEAAAAIVARLRSMGGSGVATVSTAESPLWCNPR